MLAISNVRTLGCNWKLSESGFIFLYTIYTLTSCLSTSKNLQIATEQDMHCRPGTMIGRQCQMFWHPYLKNISTCKFRQQACFCWRVENRTSVLALFEPCLMLRYMIFYFTYMSRGGVGIIPHMSLAPLHDLQLPFSATLHDLLLRLHVTGWGAVGIIPHMSLALLHDIPAT